MKEKEREILRLLTIPDATCDAKFNKSYSKMYESSTTLKSIPLVPIESKSFANKF